MAFCTFTGVRFEVFSGREDWTKDRAQTTTFVPVQRIPDVHLLSKSFSTFAWRKQEHAQGCESDGRPDRRT